jgi:YidC/Oxa1 family membrane protein insertase
MLDLLYLIFIFPVEWVIGLVFQAAYAATSSYGMAIISLAIVINVVLIPFYHLAEKWQTSERQIRNRLRPYIEEITAIYQGQERHMMLRTLYRQNNYHPIMAMRASLGLLIQIPFFVGAFKYLWELDAINGVAWGPFLNLGEPDGLLSAFGVDINLMPFVMTAVNLVSTFIYSRRLEKREKIQLYVLSGIFFVLLYTAPVALVFYWTLNNLLSILKNWIYERFNIFDPRGRTNEIAGS